MKKFITLDGVTREFTKEEYDAEDQELAKIAEIENRQKIKEEKKRHLEQKFGDPFLALERICKHLNIDFEKLAE